MEQAFAQFVLNTGFTFLMPVTGTATTPLLRGLALAGSIVGKREGLSHE